MNPRSSESRGVTIFEVTIALAITGVVVASVVQGLIGLRTARRSYQQQALANQEVANLMERVQTIPWNELNDGELADSTDSGIQLSTEFLQVVPDAELTMSVAAVDEPEEAVKVAIKIVAVDSSGREQPLASLSGWRYRFEEGGE